MHKMFSKIVIANRGEIACRIARSAKILGITTVAVYSDADRKALNVQSCDEAVYIGGSAPAESYLCADKIIQVALDCGAQAIHPGFGFLSENADFAEACASHGLVFIGPKPEAIRSMGSKSAARKIMQAAKVPVLPGYDEDDQSDEVLTSQAQEVGFPLLIKAVAGGGGKGLRAVEAENEFQEALNAVRRESKAAFGDDAVLLERYLPTARHIEIQIFADSHGNVVHLFERDCSLQRRHQKVIEEAPAPGINDILRADMAQAAIRCAKATDYLGAGTVEFLLAPDNTFFFMEMNTRLQVEHPVTEMITGQDLVAWQLKIAAGEALPVDQKALTIKGHAIEARIYAENPFRNFLPSIGQLEYLQPPQTSQSVRIDTGVVQGDEISPYYDPMIAKLICHGSSRRQALAKLNAALEQYHLIGPSSNISFLSSLSKHPEVARGGVSTRFIDTKLEELLGDELSLDNNALISAALYLVLQQQRGIQQQQSQTDDPWSPWAISDHWRIGSTAPQPLTLQHKDDICELTLHQDQGGQWSIQIETEDTEYHVEVLQRAWPELSFLVNGRLCRAAVIQPSEEVRVLINSTSHRFIPILGSGGGADDETLKDSIRSPMPGKVIACPVTTGHFVAHGTTLIVIEAMKMEHAIQASHDGVVGEIYFKVGDQVQDGDVLLSFRDADELEDDASDEETS